MRRERPEAWSVLVATALAGVVLLVIAGPAGAENGRSGDSRITLTITKQAARPTDGNQNGRIDAGDPVTFIYTVTNVGSLPVHDLRIDDPGAMGAGCVASTLDPGGTTTCSGNHVLSQSDVDTGELQTMARAEALRPDGSAVVSSPASSSTGLSGDSAVSLSVGARLEDADGDQRADPGEQVLYMFVITNTGTTTLTGLHVVDTRLQRAGDTVSCPATSLIAGASLTCGGTYTVGRRLTDRLVNRATVIADGPQSVRSSAEDAGLSTDQHHRFSVDHDAGSHAVWWWVAGGAGIVVLVLGGLLLARRFGVPELTRITRTEA